MSNVKHIKLNDNLFLVEHSIADFKPTTKRAAVDHIAVIDCSGSMAADLPRIREQLKRRVQSIVRDGDTLSLIWFSGRGQAGTLMKAELIMNLVDLKDAHERIDRWLRPIGLTGFVDPLLAVRELILHIKAQPGGLKRRTALFFMSDGQDNQWSREQILSTVADLREGISSATIVEYGYYADRRMLAEMAQAIGGTHIFADGFDAYAPLFEQAIQQHVSGESRRMIILSAQPLFNMVFSIDDGLLAFDTDADHVALINPGISTVYYLAAGPPAHSREYVTWPTPPMYGAIALFAARMRPDIIYPLLRATGDVRLIKMFASCFGKQRYTEFMNIARSAALDDTERLVAGFDPRCVPPDDAFTIFHLLELLQSDEATRVLLDHPAFEYSKISRRRVDADENLSVEESDKIADIRAEMGSTRSAKRIKELQNEIDAIIATKRDALKFVADPAPDGYAIEGLVFHESQPNISIRVKKTGTVDLTRRLADAPADLTRTISQVHDDWWAIAAFRTHIWRNYTLVANGLINVKRLPVKISHELENRLTRLGVKTFEGEGGVTIIHLDGLPILNRSMVNKVSLFDVAHLEFALVQKRAFQKVFKAVIEDNWPEAKHAGFIAKYGEEVTAWLKEQGLTESGFSPRMVVAESSDYITGRELEVSLAGYSALPPVATVKEKIALIAAGDKKAKLNGPERLMAAALTEVKDRIAACARSNIGKLSIEEGEALLKKELLARAKEITAETRALILRSARTKFAITVGQTWFSDLKSLEETSIQVPIEGVGVLKATAKLNEIRIKI